MSILPGVTVTKDPQAEKVYTFDWSAWLVGAATLASSTFAITGPDNALTFDEDAIEAGSTSATVRLLGGTVGKKYTVTNHVVTNESVPQTDDKSIKVQIVNE